MGGVGQRPMVDTRLPLALERASGGAESLNLERSRLEGLEGLDTRSNTPWRLPLAGAGGYPVRYARQAATVPELEAGT